MQELIEEYGSTITTVICVLLSLTLLITGVILINNIEIDSLGNAIGMT